MKNNKFIKIASCLGIAIPASLYAATDVNVSGSELISNDQTKIKNEVSNRIISMYSNTLLEDATMPLHTNSHTDTGANHSDSHSNVHHNNKHANRTTDVQGACPIHTDVHTNSEGHNNHTNIGRKEHTNHHTNREC